MGLFIHNGHKLPMSDQRLAELQEELAHHWANGSPGLWISVATASDARAAMTWVGVAHSVTILFGEAEVTGDVSIEIDAAALDTELRRLIDMTGTESE